jgi:hypothetical protein
VRVWQALFLEFNDMNMTENVVKDVGFVEVMEQLIQLEFKYSCHKVRTVLCVLAWKESFSQGW